MRTNAALCACAVVLGLTVSAVGEETSEGLAVVVRGLNPQESADWRSAGGVEVQARFWNDDAFGVAVAAGFESWQAETEFFEEQDSYGYFGTWIAGDASLVPVGISLLCRAEITEQVSLVFDGGLRYVFVDSGIHADVETDDGDGWVYSRDRVEIDDFLAGVVGMSLDAAVADGVSLFAGLGYQFGLTDAHEQYLGADIGSTSFQASSFHCGMAWEF